MDRVLPVLGSFKALNQHMHTGPGAHVLHFPVAGQTLLNVVAFVTQKEDWPLDDKNVIRNMTAEGSKAELDSVFGGWGPTVRNIINLLPEKLDKWAIFDMHDNPLPSYVQGRVALAGDAAHASSPHHGAGAGIGVEDALALSRLFEMVNASLDKSPPGNLKYKQTQICALLEAAFKVYDEIRPPRSQWLVKSSREACDIYEWTYPHTKDDWTKCMAEIERRSHKLWYFDIEDMLNKLQHGYISNVAA